MALTPAPSQQQLALAFPEVSKLVLIASGGFKHVFRAEIGGRQEAFKLLALPSVGTSEAEKLSRQEYINRAQREIGLLGQCQVPELVKLGSLPPRQVTIDGIEFLGYSEEFLVGQTVANYIRSGGALPNEKQCKQLLLSLLRAIRQLWTFDTVHCDIKPLNVILTASAERPFVLLDLGIAYRTCEPGITVNPATRPATRRYLAPEMLMPNFRQSLDYRADVYTAGITVFEYATFRHPLEFRADAPASTLTRVLRQAPQALKSLRNDFSDSFCRLVDQTLKKAPPLRPSNLTLLIKQLETEL